MGIVTSAVDLNVYNETYAVLPAALRPTSTSTKGKRISPRFFHTFPCKAMPTLLASQPHFSVGPPNTYTIARQPVWPVRRCTPTSTSTKGKRISPGLLHTFLCKAMLTHLASQLHFSVGPPKTYTIASQPIWPRNLFLGIRIISKDWILKF